MEEGLLAGGAVASLIGVLLLGVGFYNYRFIRLIRNLATSELGQVQEGFVEVHAQVQSGSGFAAEFSKEPAVYCEYSVQRRRGRRSGAFSNDTSVGRWKTIHLSSTGDTKFTLSDQSGLLQVSPKSVKSFLEPSWSAVYGKPNEYPPYIVEFLKSKWISRRAFFIFPRTLQLKEYRIAEDDKLFMIGWFHRRPGGRGAQPEASGYLGRKSRWRKGPFLLLKGDETNALDYFSQRMQLGLWFGGIIFIAGALAAGFGFAS